MEREGGGKGREEKEGGRREMGMLLETTQNTLPRLWGA